MFIVNKRFLTCYLQTYSRLFLLSGSFSVDFFYPFLLYRPIAPFVTPSLVIIILHSQGKNGNKLLFFWFSIVCLSAYHMQSVRPPPKFGFFVFGLRHLLIYYGWANKMKLSDGNLITNNAVSCVSPNKIMNVLCEKGDLLKALVRLWQDVYWYYHRAITTIIIIICWIIIYYDQNDFHNIFS